VKRKRYTRKFQPMAVERMRSSDNIGDLAKALGVGQRCLYKWQAKLDHLEPGEEAPRTNSHESSASLRKDYAIGSAFWNLYIRGNGK